MAAVAVLLGGSAGAISSAEAASDPTIAAAGDIACDPADTSFKGGLGTTTNCHEAATSDLLVNGGFAAVLPLGDDQYACGGLAAFQQSYDSTWGRVNAITHPVVGNHEYDTSGGTDCDATGKAGGYFGYYGTAAGDPAKGYYSFDVGSWHIVALNSNVACAKVACAAGSAQEQWLKADLAAHPASCTLAYWHAPRFSSSLAAPVSAYLPFWQDLYAAGADVVLNGHVHNYERFAPQDPSGNLDTTAGIREFVVGTGGKGLQTFTTIAPNSEIRNANTFGVLKLTLHAGSYDWQFVHEAGKTFTDSGTASCHRAGTDATPPTVPANLVATASVGTAALSWSASTDNVGVARYDVYRSTTSGFAPSTANRIAQTAATTFTDSGLAAGTYYYVVAAEDAAGNVSAPSNEAAAAVAADTQAPTVAITAPSAGATESGTTTVTASASDNVGVAGVQFRVDGVNVGGEATAAPYAVAWNTSTAGNGPHTITAVARDAAGNTMTSAPVGVTVQNAAPSATGLVAAYSFDEGSGTTAADASGNGNTGVVSNTTWTTAGKDGGALSFNGTNSWVTVNDAPSLDLTNALTLEAWVDPSQLGGWRCVMIKEQTGNLAYGLYANSDTNSQTGDVFVGADLQVAGGSQIPLNSWTHLAVTYDGSSLRLYVNGTQVGSRAVSGSIATSSGPLRLGGDSVWSEWFNGKIDDVRVYNRALSASELQTDMATPVGGTAPPPPPADTTPPTVSVTAPAAGSTVSGTTSVTASASDDVGVVGVQFQLDGAKLGAEVTTPPYAISWDTTAVANGSHTLTAVARDAAGNKTTSAGDTVTVSNSVVTPVVLFGDQLIEPSTDSNSAGTAEAFRANATSAGTLSKLSVYVDATSAATSLVVGVYADFAGHPGTLLAQATRAAPAAGAWNVVALPPTSISAGTPYWIALLGPAGGGTPRFRDRCCGNGNAPNETSFETSLSTLPATWSTGLSYSDAPLSAYGSTG